MNKSPAFQFFPGDWLASTKISLMTPAEEGAYIRLLCHAWSDPQCSLMDDDDSLASLSRLGPEWFSGASNKIRACFKKKGTMLYSERLKVEREKQREWRKKSKQGGLNSGKLRKNKDLGSKGGSDLLETKDEPKGNSPSPSPSPSSLKGIKNKGSVSNENTSCPLSFKEFLKTNSSIEVISNFKDVHFPRSNGHTERLGYNINLITLGGVRCKRAKDIGNSIGSSKKKQYDL